MAYAMTKQGSLDNCITYEFMCDTTADLNAIENRYRTIGSVAIVLSNENGDMEVYIANSNNEWNVMGGLGSTTGGAGGLSIYVCAQAEVSNGLPNIQEPDETTIYLVPAGNTSGNLYEEYIWVDSAWEKFGAASIDLSNYATLNDISGFYTKPNGGIPAADLASGVIPDTSIYAPKASPEFTGSISLDREEATTIGEDSIAIGYNTRATGYSSGAIGFQAKATAHDAFATGSNTNATGTSSFAAGSHTTASGAVATTFGIGGVASGPESVAEGYYTTASGYQAHVMGSNTIAKGGQSLVFGAYNVADTYPWDEWVSGTSYSVGDYVKKTVNGIADGYVCKEANDDVNFTSSKWDYTTKMNYLEIVGNGVSGNARSNARTLDWNGNETLAGSLTVGSAGLTIGSTTITEAQLQALLEMLN